MVSRNTTGSCFFAHLAANLGSVETVAGPPSMTSHVELTPEEREDLGIPEGLVRYSVGLKIRTISSPTANRLSKRRADSL